VSRESGVQTGGEVFLAIGFWQDVEGCCEQGVIVECAFVVARCQDDFEVRKVGSREQGEIKAVTAIWCNQIGEQRIDFVAEV